jgi:hypothetical protein
LFTCAENASHTPSRDLPQAPMRGADGETMSWVKVAVGGTLGLLFVAILVLGGILYGQNTRQSDEEVARVVSQRVRAEERRGDEAQDDALAEQRTQLDRKHRKSVKRLNRLHREKLQQQKAAAYEDGQSAGYDSGYSSGNSEGFTEGHESGLQDGSDSLTCSDDLDVSWLPYCDF